MKNKYYSLDAILKHSATYNVIFGERSNGKTYAVLEDGLRRFWEHREQLAIIRRWQDDFIGKRGQMMFANLVCNGEGKNMVSKITEGEWTDIYYWASKWYLARWNDESGKRETMDEPFCFGFALSAQEHDKSTSYPNVKTILFDEFITRGTYLSDEFVLFMNTLSTIIRHRADGIRIFMLANTVNKYACPYFSEMGLTHVRNMKQGDIDIYRYGDTRLTVAVEYAKPNGEGKASDYFFAFDNPKLQMITSGSWELDIYPHCPVKYKHADIRFEYFIKYDGELLHCEIIQTQDCLFTFIHRKTTELKDPEHDLIYDLEANPHRNFVRNFFKPSNKIAERVLLIYRNDKVFYADNETGEIMRNFLNACKVA